MHAALKVLMCQRALPIVNTPDEQALKLALDLVNQALVQTFVARQKV